MSIARKLIGLGILCLSLACTSRADLMLSFLVDPTTIDNNPSDGFITGTEFSPVGSDGNLFTMTPTNNQTGPNRFLLSAANGLSFGGGSGSTVSFDFTPTTSVRLNSYTIGGGLSVNIPLFDIREGATILSQGNSGETSGNFASTPVLQGGTTYSFVVTNNSAAVQRQMATWDYTAVPEPSIISLGLIVMGAQLVRRKRQR